MNRTVLVVILVTVLSGCMAPINTADGDETATEAHTSIQRETVSGSGTSVTSTQTRSVDSKTRGNTGTSIGQGTQTESSIDPSNWSQERKYRYFTSDFVNFIEQSEVENLSLTPDNESISIYYQINDSSEDRIRNQTIEVIAAYAAAVKIYVDNNNATIFNQIWVPKHVNVTAVDSNGEVYYTGYLKYDWVYKWKISEKWGNETYDGEERYLYEFEQTLRPGPAHPDYEEDPYDK